MLDKWAQKRIDVPKSFAVVGYTATGTNIKHGIEEEYLNLKGFKIFDTKIKGRETDPNSVVIIEPETFFTKNHRAKLIFTSSSRFEPLKEMAKASGIKYDFH